MISVTSKLVSAAKPLLESTEAMVAIKPRTAELVLVTPKGDQVGCLPAVSVATPWWPDIEPVVRAVRDHHGVEITVLRLLDAELEQPHGFTLRHAYPLGKTAYTGLPSAYVVHEILNSIGSIWTTVQVF